MKFVHINDSVSEYSNLIRNQNLSWIYFHLSGLGQDDEGPTNHHLAII